MAKEMALLNRNTGWAGGKKRCWYCCHARVFAPGDGTARRRHPRVRCARGHFADRSLVVLKNAVLNYCDGQDYEEAE